jgi:preprotein translocase subunit YajC
MSKTLSLLSERAKLATFSVLANASLATVALAQSAPAGDGPVAVPGNATGGAAGGAAPAAAAGWMNLVIFGGMILFMWFFVIRPQQKRQKEHRNFIESLKTGMEVVTSSGLIGRITSITDTIVTLDLGNTSVRVLKHTISSELGKPSLSPA